jgi:hypothetical protein
LASIGQRANGVAIEMVVMIVRQDHRIDRRQLRHGERRRREALRPGKRHRRGALVEHGVGKQTQPVDLDQHAGMTQPGDLQRLRGRAAQHILTHRHHRQRTLRLAPLATMRAKRLAHFAQTRGASIGHIAKAAVVPCGRLRMRPHDTLPLRHHAPGN